ncbi:MAG: L-threonylcarbamoyladenylate synthase [Candidatus Moranbacteria bacterium]|nr:L-threonylcarbamoyladenylate synthase [Candidatus Moranbacteria bacterium]
MASYSKLLEYIKNDKIGVIPTDTIYGIAASAWSKKAVERAYKIMRRDKKKPFIILISSIRDLDKFNIKLDKNNENILKQIWPGKVSVILPIKAKKFEYLHRGTKTLAFRVPKKQFLLKLLKKTGPLISTSANPQGKKPAQTVAEAKKYFGDKVDFYISGGKMKSLPSTLIEIKKGRLSIIRKGSGKIPKSLTKNNQ